MTRQEDRKVTDVLSARIDARMPAADDGPAERLVAGLKMVRHYEARLREQEARHKREVIEARLNEMEKLRAAHKVFPVGISHIVARLELLRAELAALATSEPQTEGEVKP